MLLQELMTLFFPKIIDLYYML